MRSIAIITCLSLACSASQKANEKKAIAACEATVLASLAGKIGESKTQLAIELSVEEIGCLVSVLTAAGMTPSGSGSGSTSP